MYFLKGDFYLISALIVCELKGLSYSLSSQGFYQRPWQYYSISESLLTESAHLNRQSLPPPGPIICAVNAIKYYDNVFLSCLFEMKMFLL